MEEKMKVSTNKSKTAGVKNKVAKNPNSANNSERKPKTKNMANADRKPNMDKKANPNRKPGSGKKVNPNRKSNGDVTSKKTEKGLDAVLDIGLIEEMEIVDNAENVSDDIAALGEMRREEARRNPNKSGNKNKRRKSKKNKNKRFKILLGLYAALLGIISVIVWIVFYNFIDGYEKGMPYNKINEIVENIKSNPDDFFKDIRVSNEFEGDSYGATYLKSLIQGKDIVAKEAKDYTSEKPSYDLTFDKTTFANVKLKEDGKVKFGFKDWSIKEVSVDEYMPSTADITVYAPANATVYINDKEVKASYVTENDVAVDALENVAEYLANVPKQTKYEIKGFFETPTVKIMDGEKELKVQSEGNTFTAALSGSEDVQSAHSEYVDQVVTAYARNFANLDKSIFNYIMPNSSLRESIESATTYFYPDSKIANTAFTAKEISNFISYTDDCFSCHVKYEYTVYFVAGYTAETDVSTVDMVWTFVQKDGNWYLTETKYYVESE